MGAIETLLASEPADFVQALAEDPSLVDALKQHITAAEAGAAALRDAIGEAVPAVLLAATNHWRNEGRIRDADIAQACLQRIDAALSSTAGAELLARVAQKDEALKALYESWLALWDDGLEGDQQKILDSLDDEMRALAEQVCAALSGADAGSGGEHEAAEITPDRETREGAICRNADKLADCEGEHGNLAGSCADAGPERVYEEDLVGREQEARRKAERDAGRAGAEEAKDLLPEPPASFCEICDARVDECECEDDLGAANMSRVILKRRLAEAETKLRETESARFTAALAREAAEKRLAEAEAKLAEQQEHTAKVADRCAENRRLLDAERKARAEAERERDAAEERALCAYQNHEVHALRKRLADALRALDAERAKGERLGKEREAQWKRAEREHERADRAEERASRMSEAWDADVKELSGYRSEDAKTIADLRAKLAATEALNAAALSPARDSTMTEAQVKFRAKVRENVESQLGWHERVATLEAKLAEAEGDRDAFDTERNRVALENIELHARLGRALDFIEQVAHRARPGSIGEDQADYILKELRAPLGETGGAT